MNFVESFPGRSTEDLCPSQSLLIEKLTSALHKVELPRNSKAGTTGVLRAQLHDFVEESGWSEGHKIDNQISLEFPTANYTLDLVQDEVSSTCGHQHRYFIEFCFDNRQAIGTNLLKFEVASQNTEMLNRRPLPILVCATAQAIKEFGWDSGVASYQEYDHAIRGPYKEILKHPPAVIAIF